MGKLIIGVGGTGTKIVRAIQQRWERVGSEQPSDVVMAVIDARERTPEEGAIHDVTFHPNTPINFNNDFQQFREYVESWWPEAVKPSGAINFGEGCGAIRAYGRYFAFRYAKKILRTIDDATQELVRKRSDNSGTQRLAFSIIVVGSLGNGTGGGTLFDVATIARHRLSQSADEVTSMGVFIPGAVTRKGNHGVLEQRVAASGFASLLELQYEFNRSDHGAVLRPKEPYQFVGWNGIDFTTFRPGAHDDATPFDSALILDEKDRNGLTLAYPSLVNMAAEGVAMLIEGGDRDYRLVDSMTMISNSGAKRFGSFGAARLMVPGGELLDYAVASHSLATLAAASSADDAPWRDLLADETPGDSNKKVLRANDATLDASVDFFIEHILRIKETGKGDAKKGDAFNQLFDRFKDEDERTLRDFDSIIDDIDRLKDAKAIVNRAVQISGFVEERTSRLAARRDSALLADDQSLWKQPSDPNDPAAGGIKWKINDRVREFVDAGAFGLLAAWLDELKKQLAFNRLSVGEHERKVWLREASHKAIDLARPVSELAREASGFFRNLHTKELIKGVGMVRQDARNKFEYLLWETKADAVEAFYDTVDAHAEKLRSAAAGVRDTLGSHEYTNRLKLNRDAIAKALDEQRDENAATSAGVKAEILLGGDAEMRAAVLTAIKAAPKAGERAVLAGIPGNSRLFAERIQSDAESLGFPEFAKELPADKNLASDYVMEIESHVRDLVNPIVNSHCSIDSVLESHAARLVDEYRRLRHEAGSRMAGRELQAAKNAITKVAGAATLDLIEQLKWESDRTARDYAIELVIAGELERMIKFATPQWSLTPDVLKTVHVTAHQFVTYPAAARRIPNAIAHLTRSSEGSLLKAQESRYSDPMRVDIVFVEVGADVDSLRMTSEFAAYRWAMFEERAFSPHLTREYHEMGLRYLEKSGDRTRQSDILLALGEEYGIVVADRTGNYKLKIEILAKTRHSEIVYPTYAPGHSVGPRGLQNVIAALDADGDGRKLQLALKSSVYEAMKNEAFGDENRRGIGWNGVASRLSSRAGKLRATIDKEKDPNIAEIVRRQADGLDALAAEIASSGGQSTPKMFA